MQYVEMSIEQANKLFKGDKNAKVLVATQNLECEDEVIAFAKRTKKECAELVRNAATITRMCDDIVNSLQLYSYRQPDIMNIVKKGRVKVILFPQEE